MIIPPPDILRPRDREQRIESKPLKLIQFDRTFWTIVLPLTLAGHIAGWIVLQYSK